MAHGGMICPPEGSAVGSGAGLEDRVGEGVAARVGVGEAVGESDGDAEAKGGGVGKSGVSSSPAW